MVDDISSLLVMLSLTAELAGIVFVLRTGQRMRASALLLRLAQNSTARCATRETSLISTFHPASRQASSAFRGSTRASASRPAWWQFPASTEIGDSGHAHLSVRCRGPVAVCQRIGCDQISRLASLSRLDGRPVRSVARTERQERLGSWQPCPLVCPECMDRFRDGCRGRARWRRSRVQLQGVY